MLLRTIGVGWLLCLTCYGQSRLSVRLEAQVGHSESVTASAYSPDGKLAATASSGVVTLWDLETQRQIYQIHGAWPSVSTLSFPGDDTLLVTALDSRGSPTRFRLETGQPVTSTPALNSCAGGAFIETAEGKDQTAIRDTRSGRIMARFPFSPATHRYGTGHDLACTSNGKVAILAVPNGDVWRAEVWDLTAGKRVRQLGSEAKSVSIVALSPDGRMAATVDEAAFVIRLWDTASGNELSQLSGLRDFTQQELTVRVRAAATLAATVAQHFSRVFDVAFSPDGKLAGASGLGSAIVWDTQTGRQVSQFLQNPALVTTVSFSPDSSGILLGNSSGVVTAFDVAMRAVSAPVGVFGGIAAPAPARGAAPAPVAPGVPAAPPPPRMETVQRAFLYGASNGRVGSLSPDGQHLFLIWNGEDQLLSRGDPLVENGAAASVFATVFGRNPYPPALYFDLKTGRSGEWPSTARVFSAAFTPDARTVVMGHVNGSITVWDIEKRKLLRTITSPSSSGAVTLLATDGKTLLAGYRNGTMRQMSLSGGEAKAVPLPPQVHADDVIVSADGSHMLLGFSGELSAGVDMLHSVIQDVTKLPPVGALTLMNGHGKVADVPTHFPPAGAGAFLPDGKSMAITDGANVSLYETEKGKKVRELPNSNGVRKLAVSSDGKKLVAATLDGELALWDIGSGRALWKLPRHGNGQVVSLRFTEKDARIYAVQSDGTSQFLDAASGKTILTLTQFSDGKWVVSTPEGRFDTPDLDTKLPAHWIASDAPFKPLPIEMFVHDYYEPRLLSRVLNGETLPPIRNLAELNRLLPTVRITNITRERAVGLEPANVTIQVEVTETRDAKTGRTSGARDLRVFGAGRLIVYAPADDGAIPLQNGKAVLEFQHVRNRGTFSVYAFNNDGVKTQTHGYQLRFDTTGFIDVGQQTGRERSLLSSPFSPIPNGRSARIISIGVDQNALPALNLQYSGNDAKRLSADLSARLEASRLYEKVIATPLISDAQHPDGATKESIRQAIVSLAGTGPTSAGRDDLVIITFAGHGYAGSGGKFYLVPSDGGKGVSPSNVSRDQILAQSISSDELAHWLRDIDTGRIVLIIDACQSAAVLGGADFKPGPMGSRGLGQLAYDKGITILAATQADNVALESGNVGHGLLTYALTQEGLENMAADWQPKDGKIELREWLHYAENRVPELWSQIQSGEISRDLVYKSDPPSQQRPGGMRQEPAVFDFSFGSADPVLVQPTPKSR
jgi:WD40 repeat protein